MRGLAEKDGSQRREMLSDKWVGAGWGRQMKCEPEPMEEASEEDWPKEI